ncbi:MAG: Lysine--tRNA ligase [Microgenomates bacterium OLB23]|nr:MAG: Lysine--tRNA ligase [Microgenomates bacterium OLB23]
MAQIDEIRKNSIEKLEKIRALGWNPYASRFTKQHSVAQALTMVGQEVQTAGKLTSIRTHGNITFADIKDVTGDIQVFFKKDSLGAEAYKNLKLLDAGDVVGCKGVVGKTSTGETSIIATEYMLLTKSILPLPNEWYGLKDVETRYRKRYLDLQLNPHVKDIFIMRSKVVTLLRNYLDEHGFLEVETPVLQPIYGGAYAKPFITQYNALESDFYLRIAVELYLKRLLVGGFEKVYELGKNFRNEGFSRAHNPEFTMLEFYWAYADYEDLMKFTEEMLTHVIKEINGSLKVESEGTTYDFTAPWERKTYRELFIEHMQLDINEYSNEEKLTKIVEEKKLLDQKVVGYGQMLDELYKKYVRPHLKGPLFVTEYPLEIKALAKASEKDSTKSASFQLLLNGIEMINAYNELNDPLDQKARWEEEMKLAARGGEDYQVLDDDYIEALSYGMPPTAGWGMGIDRMVAFLAGQHSIKETILFPTVRPEHVLPQNSAPAMPAQRAVITPSAQLTITRDIALNILTSHLKNRNLINHCKAVEAVMGALAERLGGDAALWKMAGLLHDADWEETQSDPSQHTHKTVKWIQEAGESSEELINCIYSHNHHHNGYREPVSLMEWSLYCCDELTGFIVAVALVRPEKKLASVTSDAVLKKFPQLAFARPVDRAQIKLCEEKLGIPLDEFVSLALSAMQGVADDLGL